MSTVSGAVAKVAAASLNSTSHIAFNTQQLAALADMVDWVARHANDNDRNGQVYILQGYAGTGKTTLVRELLNRLTIPISRVALVAPTNRAAKVLQNKTGLHTTTIHKLIYLTVQEELDAEREKLAQWNEALNFTDLADLIIESNETSLQELFLESGGGTEAEYLEFVEAHRVLVLSYEGVVLPDDDAQRLEYFTELKQQRIKEHKDNIRELLKEDLKVRRKDFREVVDRFSLILVDEASMVNEQVGKDLVSFGVPVILVGDPFQLPPVKAKPYWHNRRADSVLTKIERQKGAGAGIPLAGEQLRNGKRATRNESLGIHSRGTLPDQVYLDANQIIAGTHKVRERMCRVIRNLRGFSSDHPQVGEKIVATYNDRNEGIMNGEIYTVLKSELIQNGLVTRMDIEDPYGKVIEGVTAWTEGFAGRSKTQYLSERHGRFWWGYCITCHQSQGSEWEHVVVCNDWPGEEHARWLYTAITRASKKCDLVGY